MLDSALYKAQHLLVTKNGLEWITPALFRIPVHRDSNRDSSDYNKTPQHMLGKYQTFGRGRYLFQITISVFMNHADI